MGLKCVSVLTTTLFVWGWTPSDPLSALFLSVLAVPLRGNRVAVHLYRGQCQV